MVVLAALVVGVVARTVQEASELAAFLIFVPAAGSAMDETCKTA